MAWISGYIILRGRTFPEMLFEFSSGRAVACWNLDALPKDVESGLGRQRTKMHVTDATIKCYIKQAASGGGAP